MLSAEVEVPAMYRKATASSHHLQVFWVDNFRLQKKPEGKWSGGRQMDASRAWYSHHSLH